MGTEPWGEDPRERFDPNVLATCFGSSSERMYATIGHHGFMLGGGCNSDEKAMGRPKKHIPTETTMIICIRLNPPQSASIRLNSPQSASIRLRDASFAI